MGVWRTKALAACGGAWALLACALLLTPGVRAAAERPADAVHEGVASCSGSTCHGRQEATGTAVRQNEILTWQDESSPAGAHARAYRVLFEPRSQAIADRLGIGPADRAPACLSCHADAPPPALRGARFALADGVGCEACHGGASTWIASHTAVGVDHAANVARGLVALDRPKIRAAVCLDCHFGGAGDRFVSHRVMAAGHPRIAFELDLFSALQQHHDEDADYRARKPVAGGVKTWAIGQAMAVERAVRLYAQRGRDGVFPEFSFLDCRTCHRQFGDEPSFEPAWQPNPGRPIAAGMPAFNDENMLMLAAAAKIAAPALAGPFERASRAFHASFVGDHASNTASALRLAATARQLADRFDAASFTRAQGFAILDELLTGATAERYTDYQGGAQAVMAVDTLLNALAAQGQIDQRALAALRPDIDRAYALVRNANGWRPDDFRRALQRIAGSLARLK